MPATTWNDVYNRYSTKLRIEEDIISRSQKEEKVSSRRAKTEKGPVKIDMNHIWAQREKIHDQNWTIQGTIIDREIEGRAHHQDLGMIETRESRGIMIET